MSASGQAEQQRVPPRVGRAGAPGCGHPAGRRTPARAGGSGTGPDERARTPKASARASAVYRHPGDVVRLLVGLSVLGLLSVLAAGGVLTRLEGNTFRVLNELPGWLDGPVRIVTQAGWIGAAPLAAAVALAARRRRLAVDLAAAGAAAWVLAKVVKDLAHRGRPGVLLEDVILRGVPATGHGFVSGHAAVAAALATIASSQVSRRTRRRLWAVVWLVAGARVYSGAHLPLDVVGGAALGWAVAAAVQLLRGTPARSPGLASIVAGLAAAGVEAAGLRPLAADARGSQPFVADGPGGGVFVKVVGRDQRDADVLFRVGRWLAFREVGDEAPLATAKQQIEHEAYLLLAAARAGARVPELLATGSAGDGASFLAERRVRGADAASASPLGDEGLRDIWRQVAALRRARIAHRDLRLANVVLDDAGRAWLVDFGFAQAGATDDQLARDVAELLASSATAAGADQAVAAALDGVGLEALQQAAPLLQPLALSTATRRRLAGTPGVLDAVRDALAAIGIRVEPRPLLRVRLRPAALVAVAAAGYATHHLLVAAAGTSGVASVLAATRWRWLVLVAVVASLQYLFAALALAAAAGRPLALGRTMASHLASTFASRGSLREDAGGQTRAAYLCSAGLNVAEAEEAVQATRAAGFVVHTGALVVATAAALISGLRVVEPPRPAALVVTALVVTLLGGLAAWVPANRRALARAAVPRLRRLRRLAEHPGRSRLLASQVGVTAALAAAFLAAMRAASVEVPAAPALALYLAAAAVAAGGPLPGGLGVVEPALAAGLMVLGVAAAPAVAAAILFRAVTYWLPLAPGAFAFWRLQRQGRC